MISKASSRTLFALAIALQFLAVEASYAQKGGSGGSRSSGGGGGGSRPSSPSSSSSTKSTTPSPSSGSSGSWNRGSGGGGGMQGGGTPSGSGGGGGSQRGGFGTTGNQVYRGGTEAAPGKAPALKPGLSTTAKVGGGVAAGIVAGAAGAYATSSNPDTERAKSSTRPQSSYSYMQPSTASRLRENAPVPPGLQQNRSQVSSSGGWLEPSFSNMVFSPIYFMMPFNIWHPRTSQSANGSNTTNYIYSSSSPGAVQESLSSLSESSAFNGSAANIKPYQGREVGASEINQLPEWIQASLRLMQTKQKTMLPSDPDVQISKMTDQEFEDKVNATATEINGLKADVVKKRATVDQHLQLARLKEYIKSFEANRSASQDQMTRANNEIAEIKVRKVEAEAEIKRLQSESTLCSYLGWYCNDVAAEPIASLERAKSDEEYLSSRYTRNFRYVEEATQRLSALNVQLATAEQQLGNDPANTLEAVSAAIAKDQQMMNEKATALKKLEGFVKWNSNGVKLLGKTIDSCPAQSMYVFRFLNTLASRHPLFGEAVETELVPSHEAELVVCLNTNGKLASVHIIQNKEELYSTTIGRDEKGAINHLAIANDKAVEIEEHFWTQTPEGNLAYGQKFLHGDQMYGIRAEIPAR